MDYSSNMSVLTTQTYDVLPDAETWCNTSCLMKYPERPTVSTVAVSF